MGSGWAARFLGENANPRRAALYALGFAASAALQIAFFLRELMKENPSGGSLALLGFGSVLFVVMLLVTLYFLRAATGSAAGGGGRRRRR